MKCGIKGAGPNWRYESGIYHSIGSRETEQDHQKRGEPMTSPKHPHEQSLAVKRKSVGNPKEGTGGKPWSMVSSKQIETLV